METDSRRRVLIALKSCAGDVSAGHNQVVRETWGRHVNSADVMFFVGAGSIPLQQDEIRVDAPDGYYSLPQKTCAILRWATIGPYQFIFMCDTDTFVRPEKLLASGFEHFDLVGLFAPRHPGAISQPEGYYGWPSGGGGYWLSSRAAALIAQNNEHKDWAEDRMVGQILGPHVKNGTLRADSRMDYGAPETNRNLITAHYCAKGMQRDYDPQWMRRMYRKFYQGGM